MEEKILFVDDEPNVLHSIKRQFRKRFSIETAEGGEEALKVLKEEGPFAVIVSDMRMPGMTGIELLARVKDLYPDMVRMMLTGNADQDTAIEAVNSGHIFRFLTKPCPPATFITALALAQRQHRLLTAEKELLHKTLKGSISVLSEILSTANPIAFSSGLRIKKYVVKIAENLNLPGLWQYEIAALMSQIGCATLPGNILNKRYAGVEMTPEELDMFSSHPEIGANLLEQIPRLENVVRMIALQQLPFAEHTEELHAKEYEEVLTGAQILKTVLEFDRLLFLGTKRSDALNILQKNHHVFNPKIVSELAHIPPEYDDRIVSLAVKNITAGMVAVDDVLAKNGVLVIPKGQTITRPLVQGLRNFARQVGIVEPIRVKIGIDEQETA